MLVASTLPHLLAIGPIYTVYPGYGILIFTSTTASVLWHAYGEPVGTLLLLDYGLAGIWGAYDLWLGVRKGLLLRFILLNMIVAYVNTKISRGTGYATYHSLWHLLSCAKAIYVSWLISHT
uniref:Uncharacterized protein n=1 Tax=viral metagenome TaxID=1070528 RepID=A0A6C0BI68_9ZZZZ